MGTWSRSTPPARWWRACRIRAEPIARSARRWRRPITSTSAVSRCPSSAGSRGTAQDSDTLRGIMPARERMDALFIAAINGHCLGGGLQLALVCDYRLASADARLGLPAVKERLIPSMSLYRLPRLIGLARAQELILLGEPIDARQAE